MIPHRFFGAEIDLVHLEENRLTIHTASAQAPGAPLVLEVAGRTIEARTIGTKRRDDGRHEVRCRLVNVRREDRAALQAEVGRHSNG